MNQDWGNFLATQGAQLQDGAVQHFGDAAAERIATRDGTVLCDLSQFGIVKVSGEEAKGFLHNLFSSDVNALTPQHALPSSFNTAKGRILATFLIWRNDTEYFLHLPLSLLAAIQKKLSMFVLRCQGEDRERQRQHRLSRPFRSRRRDLAAAASFPPCRKIRWTPCNMETPPSFVLLPIAFSSIPRRNMRPISGGI